MTGSTANELKKLGIGKKIAALRAAKNMNVEQLAEKLRLSKVILLQIENEVVPPTVATLLNISKALGVGIDHFFTDAEEAGKIEVTRRDERLAVHHDDVPTGEGGLNYSYESLAYRLSHKHMEPFFVEFDNENSSARRSRTTAKNSSTCSRARSSSPAAASRCGCRRAIRCTSTRACRT